MQLNADLSLAATVDSASLAWIPSPMASVERRMLERDGDEVARATSLVRYAPGSSFAAHAHGAGEEFLVLEGIFSDDTGDFGPGYYVRNPPGSRHVPASAPGAVIFVKLRQMPAQEAAFVRIATHDSALWQASAEGCHEALLFDAAWERVVMQRLAVGYHGEPQAWIRGAEFFVVEGALQIDGITHGVGSWLRRPAGSRVAIARAAGALLYRKTGHLG